MNTKDPNRKATPTYKKEEFDWPKDANEGGQRWRPGQRIEYIKMLFSRGILDPHRGDLAKKFGVDRCTLWQDFQKIYDMGIEPGELKIAKVKMGAALNNAMVEASTLVATSKGREKGQALNALVAVAGSYTAFLEKFDVKRPGIIDTQKPIVIRWADDKKGGG
jgi:hypothetical protein